MSVRFCPWGRSPGRGDGLRGSVDLDSEQGPDLLRQTFEMEIFYILFELLIWEVPLIFQ